MKSSVGAQSPREQLKLVTRRGQGDFDTRLLVTCVAMGEFMRTRLMHSVKRVAKGPGRTAMFERAVYLPVRRQL